MKKWVVLLFLILLVISSFNSKTQLSAQTPQGIKIGWGHTNITPDLSSKQVFIWGEYNPPKITSVHDSLTSTAMAIESASGDMQAIMVSIDIGEPGQEIQSGLRTRLAGRLPGFVDTRNLFVFITHTHTAPYTFDGTDRDYTGCIKGSEFKEFMLNKIADMVVSAWNSRAPASVAIVGGVIDLGWSRATVYQDGHAVMYGSVESDKGSVFKELESGNDHVAGFIYTFDKNSKLQGIVVNINCSSQVAPETAISADWWSEVRSRLNNVYPGVFILPQLGVAGDQTPTDLFNRNIHNYTWMTECANRIVNEIINQYNNAYNNRQASMVLNHRVRDYTLTKKSVFGGTLPFELHALRIGDAVLANYPFELYIDYGFAIKARSMAKRTFLVEQSGNSGNPFHRICDDPFGYLDVGYNQGYLHTARADSGQAYGTWTGNGPCGPEAGKELVEQSVSLINSLFDGSSTSIVDEENPGIKYTGSGWASKREPGYHGLHMKYTTKISDYVEFSFTGTSIKWFDARNNDRGKADVYIDNVKQATIDEYSSVLLYQQEIYRITGLSNSSHIIKIVNTGTKNDKSNGNLLGVDYFVVGSPGINPLGITTGSKAETVRDKSGIITGPNNAAGSSDRPAKSSDNDGPILVITGTNNLFSTYYTIILKTEGLNEFATVDVSKLNDTALHNFDVVILGNISLNEMQVTMLTDWVKKGGHLIAMRPDKQLAGLLGLTSTNLTMTDGYILIDTSNNFGRGIAGKTLQFHGTADKYTLNGAKPLAVLYSGISSATSYPAVTINSVGPNGGSAAVFTYDLARSVVLTRQGNPAWTPENVVGTYGETPRYHIPMNLFYRNWFDTSRINIPQADEQMHFLSNLVLRINAEKNPLPRFWYLPKGLNAAIVMTGDDHHSSRSWRMDINKPENYCVKFFNLLKAFDPPVASLDDWECYRASSYGYTGDLLTSQEAIDYAAEGFEFALHPDSRLFTDKGVENYIDGWVGNWEDNYASDYSDQFNNFTKKYSGYPIVSSRNHGYAWKGYADFAREEVTHGIRLDVNFTYWPRATAREYFMGSVMPMEFAQLNRGGEMTGLLDIYNAGTHLDDDNGSRENPVLMRKVCDAYLDAANGPLGYYGIFVTNCHSDNTWGWSYEAMDQICQSAKTHGVPVVSGSQMVKWLDGRNSSSFRSVKWDGNSLKFNISVGTGARNLRAMVPVSAGLKYIKNIELNGNPVTFTKRNIKGIEYAFFNADDGSYTADYLAK